MLVSNATLTKIETTGGSLDDYEAEETGQDVEDTGTPPTVTWQGSEEAYLDQRTGRIGGAEGSEYQKRWTVYLQHGRPPVTIGIGDILTLTQPQADGSTLTTHVPVQSVDDRQEPDMPSDVQTVALIVEPTAP